MKQAFVKALACKVAPLALAAVLATACTVRGVREAPIEDKSTATRTAQPAAPTPGAMPTPPPGGPREATGGTYTVQRGDTLYSIAVAFGQDYRDIARWNNLEDPTRIAVGQSLRVTPPEGDTSAVVGVVTVNPSAPTETRPLEAVPQAAPPIALPPPAAPAPSSSVTPPPVMPGPSTVPSTTPDAATKPVAPVPPAAAPSATPLWQWPSKGKVIDAFSEGRNKGIDIGGAEGDPVLAASDGEVVYSGSGLRTYGNLVIIKHNDDFISAYGHNKQILVKQGQAVRRGQRIADLGKSDDGLAKLHFEIRYRGKPVDPAKYLPKR
jgi:lipoprotein NlpD